PERVGVDVTVAVAIALGLITHGEADGDPDAQADPQADHSTEDERAGTELQHLARRYPPQPVRERA
ncbi:MAG: hypothetical protein WAT66_08950, partial [Actinomycetota bacterium]